MSIHDHAQAPAESRGRGNTSRPRARRVAVFTAAAVLLSGFTATGAAHAETLPVGTGSYTTDAVGPAPEGCAPLATDARAYVTDFAPAGAVPTNDWWSSLLFKKYNCVGSEPLHAHPLSYLPQAAGMGHGAFGAGNNQESSSEGQNFANGLIQWGTATGDTATRDAGIYLYATQTAAIQQYWFDESGAMPDAFGHSTAGMIWGDGGTYSTWFSAEAEMVQGINTLPITGGHLYLGLRPTDVAENYNEMVAVNGGNPDVWQDIVWSYLALGDAPAALAKLDNDREYPEEEGESRAHTYHWIANLASLGTLDAGIHADDPMAAAFTKDGATTYVASNITQAPISVTFSDGTVLDVPVGKTVTSGAQEWSGGGAPSGAEEPTDPTDPGTPPAATTTTFYLGTSGSFLAAPGTAATTTRAPRTGGDAVGDASAGLVLTANNLNGTFAGSRTAFDIGVDTLGVGNATRIRVSYDLTGDGTYDRIETYNYFPTDPVPGYERYTADRGSAEVVGDLGALVDGSMKVELWNVLGNAESTIDLATSVVKAPFSGLMLGSPGTDPGEDPPSPSPRPRSLRPGAPAR